MYSTAAAVGYEIGKMRGRIGWLIKGSAVLDIWCIRNILLPVSRQICKPPDMNTIHHPGGRAGIRIEGVQPILSVKDMHASRVFYKDILGFEEAGWGTDEFTSMNRENAGIYLCHGAQGNPGTWLWIGFDGDIRTFHDYLIEKGVQIRLAPTNYPWAMEMHVEDPDGHILRFGTDPDTTQPFAGE